MIIYKDIFSGEEMFTDAYRVTDEDTYFKFMGKLTKRSEGKIDDSLIGANASAEEAQEQTDETVESGLDFVLTAHLNEIGLSKGDLKTYLKTYFKKLQKKLFPDLDEDDDKVQEFKKRSEEFAKFVLKNQKDLCFYFGETDYASENSCCFVKWLSAEEVEVYAFKEGLEQEKY